MSASAWCCAPGQAKGLIIEAVTDDNSWLEFKVRNDKGKIECLKQEDLLKRCTHTQVIFFYPQSETTANSV